MAGRQADLVGRRQRPPPRQPELWPARPSGPPSTPSARPLPMRSSDPALTLRLLLVCLATGVSAAGAAELRLRLLSTTDLHMNLVNHDYYRQPRDQRQPALSAASHLWRQLPLCERQCACGRGVQAGPLGRPPVGGGPDTGQRLGRVVGGRQPRPLAADHRPLQPQADGQGRPERGRADCRRACATLACVRGEVAQTRAPIYPQFKLFQDNGDG